MYMYVVLVSSQLDQQMSTLSLLPSCFAEEAGGVTFIDEGHCIVLVRKVTYHTAKKIAEQSNEYILTCTIIHVHVF